MRLSALELDVKKAQKSLKFLHISELILKATECVL